MEKLNFNADWDFMKLGNSSMAAMFSAPGSTKVIQLPHDAMIHEERTESTPNGAQTGFYPGGQYVFTKTFDVPDVWKEKAIMVEFEGVYQSAMVFVNGAYAGKNMSGYSNFYIDLKPFLNYGESNQIKVIADNSAEPNSRWYSGSGIYRNVKLLLGDKIHIASDGVKIKTKSAMDESAIIEIETEIRNTSQMREKIKVEVSINDEQGIVATDTSELTIYPNDIEHVRQQICILNPKLWDCDAPNLYRCNVKLMQENKVIDETNENIGIRTVRIDALHGLQINGKPVKLRGTCIHHDNGIIGAATLARAEERKCELLKAAGFNSIRSAHHPISKDMLNSCDKYGILVMDELSDMWNYHKNPQDFALNFEDYWEQEVERMVVKDYNHPSVILYSTGNEIPEMGTSSGARMNRKISNKFHELDADRYTTMGLNGLMALAFGGGMSTVLSDIAKSLQGDTESGGTDGAGANGINVMASIMDGEGADQFARHQVLSDKIKESEEAVDVIGLNYLTGRHEMEHILHPNKAIVGSETYPADIFRLWSLVKKNPFILGDYTWTGYDYLGEAGCGIFHYDGSKNFSSIYPERVAYIGDIDLIGNRRPISYYREIVYGLRKEPYIAVERVDKVGQQPTKTAWMFKDNISSWTWPGYEGIKSSVDVYADADEVELFLNGRTLGRKPIGVAEEHIATYEVAYEPGELKARSFIAGEVTGEYLLKTAEQKVRLFVDVDRRTINSDGEDLSFISVKLVDDSGVWNMFEQRKVTIEVTGDGTLQGVGSANPQSLESYDDYSANTYDGAMMAVVRAGRTSGSITVNISTEGCESQTVEILVV